MRIVDREWRKIDMLHTYGWRLSILHDMLESGLSQVVRAVTHMLHIALYHAHL